MITQRILGVQFRVHFALFAVFEAAALAASPLLATRLFVAESAELTTVGWEASLCFVASALVSMTALGVFSARQRARPAGILLRIGTSVLIGAALGLLMVTFAHVAGLSWRLPMAVVPVAFFLATTAYLLILRIADEDVFRRRVIVYGTGRHAASIAQLRRSADTHGFRVIGFVQPPGEHVAVDPGAVLGSAERLIDLAQRKDIHEIVVAMDDRRRSFPLGELLECRLAGVDVTELMTFLERETGKVRLDVLNPSWIIFGNGFRRGPIRLTNERVFDVVTSLLLLLVTWPLFILTGLLIKLEDGLTAPVLYRQTRVGFLGREFELLKFRSMRRDAERERGPQWALPGDTRVTRIGAIIRRIRVDELPQLVNVLRGDMSFVGPRPERPQFVALLSATIPYYEQRHYVKPGITGWAQVCYRYGASEKDAIEKLQYDLYYVKNHSLLFDIMVLLQTAEVILLRKGAR